MNGFGLLLILAAAGGDVGKLDWLSGAWVKRRTGGAWTEEYWTPPRGGLMIGAGLDGKGDALRHFEQMRIETAKDGKVAFVAMPGGGAAVRFPMVKQSSDEIVFENAANDYPQRVSYRRDGKTIVASIARLDGSRETRWVYSRP